MPEKRAWFLAPGCVVVIIILSLVGYGLYWFLRPSNVTQVEGDLTGGMVENEALINFKPEVDLDLHGDRCWAVIVSLVATILLIISAIIVIPKVKEQRTRKRAEREQVTLTLDTLISKMQTRDSVPRRT